MSNGSDHLHSTPSKLSVILLNGQHESRTISTYMLSIAGMGLENAPPPQYSDSIVKNDVWIGDEVMMLGGGIIGARSLLPPNFRSEPYGIYADTLDSI